MPLLTRRTVAAGVLSLPAIRRVRADTPIRLRCSLDTAPTHGRNISIGDYLGKVEAASKGRLKTEIFASGQLFADLNVTKALVQGQVDMAAPGTWAITNFVPDSDVFQLPAGTQPISVWVPDGLTVGGQQAGVMVQVHP